MSTVHRLAAGLEAMKQLGYRVREECLGGDGGGACEINGQKWLFLDLEKSTEEQLELVIQAIDEEFQRAAANMKRRDAA